MTSEERYYHAYLMLLHWIESIYIGKKVSDYFIDEGINDIAIYGMGDMANRLMEGLVDSKVEVKYGIDRDVAGTVSRIDNIYSVVDDLPAVKAVVVTPFYAFETIVEQLRVKLPDVRFISIEEVIWSM